MAAQKDAPPLSGANPTWSWVRGEEITDQLPLAVAADARPGLYELQVGYAIQSTAPARQRAIALANLCPRIPCY